MNILNWITEHWLLVIVLIFVIGCTVTDWIEASNKCNCKCKKHNNEE